MFDRRRVLGLLGLAAPAIAFAPRAIAQAAFPAKPLHIIVPFQAGGETDIVTRRVVNQLQATRGYTVVVDNFVGAGGDVGTERALREGGDGYTLVVVSAAYAANAAYSHPGVDALARIQPIVEFEFQPGVLLSSLKYNSAKELFDAARKSPEATTFGTAGVGSLSHLSSENLSLTAGFKSTHVPYKGDIGAVTDLASGRIDWMTAGVSAARSLVKSGKVRMLAVFSKQRMPEFPDVPTLIELGIPFESGLYHGLVAAKGAPPSIVQRLNADINAALRDPALIAGFKEDLLTPTGGTPEQFRQTIAKDVELMQRIVKTAHITPQ